MSENTIVGASTAQQDRNRQYMDSAGVPPRSSKRKGYVNENKVDSNEVNTNTSYGNGDLYSGTGGQEAVENASKEGDSRPPPAPVLVLQKTASESFLSNSRRLRANTVGWSGKSPHINAPAGYSGIYAGSSLQGSHSQHNSEHHTNSNNTSSGADSNVEKSNAYFRRLSTLPERKPIMKQKFKITNVCRKLLFAFSEIYSALKRFNLIGNNDRAVQERMSMVLALAKRQINHLVEVLENVEDKDNEYDHSIPRLPEIICKVVKKNITVFKDVIQYLVDNLTFFTDKADVCFIRMLLLSLFGCYNEVHNAWSILIKGQAELRNRGKKVSSSAAQQPQLLPAVPNVKPSTNTVPPQLPLAPQAKVVASTQLSIPATSSKSQLAGARISVVDPKDEKLYASSQSAITTAQRVCKIIIDTMKDPNVEEAARAHKNYAGVEELILNCSQIQSVSRKLDSTLASLTRSVFDHSNTEEQYNRFMVEQEKYKRIFLADFDSFVTKVIRVLALFKLIMNDFPELRGLRSDMLLLSRTAKELIALFKPGAKNNDVGTIS